MGVADGEGVELVHHGYGREHILVVAATVVAGESESHVDGKPPPKKSVGSTKVEVVAIGEVGVGGGFGREGAVVEGMDNHVAGTGGTVVAEEIVLIVAVVGLVVEFEKKEEVVDLLVGEAEALLPYGAAFVLVFEKEIEEGGAAEVVVEVASGEFPIKVGGVEVEGAIIVDDVDALGAVADAEGGVAKGGIELFARTAGDEGGEGGVAQVGEAVWDLCPQGEGKEKYEV